MVIRGKKRKLIIAETQNLLKIYGEMTLRQIYYKLISKGIGKSGKSFSNDLSKILCKARRYGIIDPSKIIDNSREIRYTNPYTGIKQFSRVLDYHIRDMIDTRFTLDLWKDQKELPIINLEKFTLADIFQEITDYYKVPLIVNRGMGSDSKLHELSTLIKPNVSLVFQVYSDYDSMGSCMPKYIKDVAQFYLPYNYYRVEVSALTLQQIQNPKYGLKTISKTYKSGITKQICELDALDPNDLKQIIRDNIENLINDKAKFQLRLKQTEKAKAKLRAKYP